MGDPPQVHGSETPSPFQPPDGIHSRHSGGQSVSEKSLVTRTSKNVFEKSNSKTQYFVSEVKGRRMTKYSDEFLIG
jgi:hypothetical protein